MNHGDWKTRIVFESAPGIDGSDGSNGRFPRPPAHVATADWALGWTDGRLGQPAETVRSECLASARSEANAAIDKIKQDISARRAHLAQIEEAQVRWSERAATARARHEELREFFRANPSQVGLVLGVLFLLFSAVLLAADLPLSLSLVAEGFRVPVEAMLRDASGAEQLVRVDDLLIQPVTVFRHFWPALFLAAGITLAPMLVKLLLESWFGSLTTKTEDRKRMIFLALLSALLLVTLVALGQFRAMSFQESLHTAATLRHSEITSLLNTFGGVTPSATAMTEPQASLPQWLMTVTFVLLTITLPLIGAVFFTVGWARLSGSAKRLGTWISVAYSERRHLALLRHAVGVQGEVETLENCQLARMHTPEYLETLARTRAAFYEHGYERGKRVAVSLRHGEGVYERSKLAILSRMAERESLRSLNDEMPSRSTL